MSARHDTRDSDLVSDVWRCAPDGSDPEQITVSSDGETKLSIDQIRFAPDGASVYFTAEELGSSGRDMLGRNVGLWSVPVDGSAAPQPAH